MNKSKVNITQKTNSPFASWGYAQHEPLVIAGPCSAESEQQILSTAHAIKNNGSASIFRAGAWKPRTRPGSFEGIGTKALGWLEKAKAETGLKMATEVANAWHVDDVLKHNIDVIWIGARTTVNPFYVQEIANALRGVNIPVLVKNPLHPDLGLWIGAIERFEQAGIEKIAAIHRGFYTQKPSPFRNEPKWELSFEMRREAPNLPILCDPSHIAGKRDLIFQVAQTAMDVNLDGLMIETHMTPESALSDAAQQITPNELQSLLSKLVIKNEEAEEARIVKMLDALRVSIDGLDMQLLDVLEKRFEKVDEIGAIKQAEEIAIFQIKRWFEMTQDRLERGTQKGLDKNFVHELFSVIHKFSVKRQTEILQRKKP